MNSAQLFIYAIPAFAVLMLVEWIAYRRDPDRPAGAFAGRDTASNVATYVIGRVSRPLTQFLIPFSGVVLAASLTPLHLPANQPWVWLVALVATDFCYYWAHRADHRVRLLWTAHSVHHSSEYFNISTAARLPWLNPVANVVRAFAWVPAALIGLPAWLIFLWQALGLLYQLPIHTQRIGTLPRPIEFLFNTPAHHRIHHGSNKPYIDRNYGGVFIVWDRMFGTFASETEPIRYGLTTNIGTDNPLKVNYHEVAALIRDVRYADTWTGRLGYIFGPPGWQEPARVTATADPDPARTVASVDSAPDVTAPARAAAIANSVPAAVRATVPTESSAIAAAPVSAVAPARPELVTTAEPVPASALG